jgi:LmbE family N-acetylglucosaminyl deacetylase
MMRRVLAVGAHPDDIELGCAGTISAHRAAGDLVTMLVLTGGQNGPGRTSERWAEAQRSALVLDVELIWSGLIDCTLVPDSGLIATIEHAITACAADVIYVHAPDDSHQDHRAAASATLSAARLGSRVLHYRSPSTVHFTPTVFVDISDHLGTKLAALDCHRTQVDGSAMVDPEIVVVSARYFGALARLQYAEAFSPTRFVWDLATTSHQTERTGSARSRSDRSRPDLPGADLPQQRGQHPSEVSTW